jgi:hypothetical protein
MAFDFYQYANEEAPSNLLSPRGLPVQINVFIDANHEGNKLTRCSHTGILIYLNRSPTI